MATKRKTVKLSTRKKSQSWYRKKCVEIAKNQAKERDGHKCQRCSRTKLQGYQIHGSHNYPESIYKSMSADVDNILTLCAVCHMWWHENPIEASKWFNEKYKDLSKELLGRSQKIQIINWEERYHEMKKLCTGT